MKSTIRPLLAAIMISAAVLAPVKAATASTLPLQLWNNVALPTANPAMVGGSVAGWSLPATSAPGLWNWAADGLKNQTVPYGHVQYEVLRPAGNSCHSVVAAAWWDGTPQQGVGVWDHCQYNGWVWWRHYGQMVPSGPDHYLYDGRFASQTLKSGSTWSTYFWNHSIQAWILAFSTTGVGPYANGEAAFRYSQSAWNGQCQPLARTRIDQLRVNTTSGWINAGLARAVIPVAGCFVPGQGGWSFSEGTTWPNWLRANTP